MGQAMPSKHRLGAWFAFALCALAGLLAGAAPARAANEAVALTNTACLTCHDAKAHKIEVPGAADKPRALMGIAPEKYYKSVHANMACVACHTGITANPPAGAGHKQDASQSTASVMCADCHEKLWESAQKDGTAAVKPRLGIVVQNIDAYRNSFHARPRKADKSQPNAYCDNCHDTHSFNIPTRSSTAHDEFRLSTPAICGATCHSDELDEYTNSIHGKQALGKHNTKAAVCTDCHTSHDIGNTSAALVKLTITANCGTCHTREYKSYKATYHGQITSLGYANTAKCFDCHGSHGILPAKDPDSKVNPANRLDTCKSCHNGKKVAIVASAGFATFQPHAHNDDFANYPQTWIGYHMMVGLLVGTFAFFWLHTALWFYREVADRRSAKLRPHVKAEAIPAKAPGKQFQRFSAVWRAAHLTFAISLMLLTLTGMPLLYAETPWAPKVMAALGGPTVAGNIHRVCAVIFAGVFLWHIVYIAIRLWRHRKTFDWFGPNSLVPNLKDLDDIIGMFKWFLGAGPRPLFDRWTYWEKFDYWAPFWGVTIIGVSGLMMWVPHLTGTFLPGWVFNVAAIFHGEEAFLAVVFLFTVHFFNNHFRPEKFPLETVMFTGAITLDEFRHEHALEYERLVKTGELEKYLVDAPSAPMRFGAKVLGFTLIAFGLTLLFGVGVGFFGSAG
jgi:cytochrome b subunit of formate dehydrogenase